MNNELTKLIAKKKFISEIMNKPERLDRTQWKQYQNVMQDSAKFVELLHTIEFEDGMTPEIIQGILFDFSSSISFSVYFKF